MRKMLISLLGLTALLATGSVAQAQSVSLSAGGSASPSTPAKSEGGRFILAAKGGGLVAFSKLSPNARVALELGYNFPWLKRSLAFTVDVGYAAPKASGTETDPRMPSGTYNWHLTEQELTITPAVFYRLSGLGKITLYGGIGPRIYMLRSNTRGDSGGVNFPETKEQSTKVGGALTFGLEYGIGPGGILAELLSEYGPLNHSATGTSNTGATSLLLGYRFLL